MNFEEHVNETISIHAPKRREPFGVPQTDVPPEAPNVCPTIFMEENGTKQQETTAN